MYTPESPPESSLYIDCLMSEHASEPVKHLFPTAQSFDQSVALLIVGFL